VVVQIYAVAITNSLTEQLAKHLTVDTTVRVLVSLGVVLVLNLIFLMGRHITIKVMGFLVFPLIAYFLFVSLYLTGSWQPSLLTSQMVRSPYAAPGMDFDSGDGFAFSHTPIISTFAVDRREKFGDAAMGKCKKIMKVAYLIICLSVLFFVFSCLLDSAVVHCGRQRGRGNDPVRAVDDALFSGVAGHFRDYRGDYCDVEIVPRHLFWGD
jgi:amino acid permease